MDDDDDKILINTKLVNVIRKKKSIQEKLERIKKYLDGGADVNTIDRNDNGNTSLHIAVRKQELKIVQFLLDKGATVDIKNTANESPLDLAYKLPDTERKKQEIIKILKIYEKKQDLSINTDVSEIDKQPNLIEQNNFQISKQSNRQNYYEKRSGTSGISGQLYETKLSCLILFRALNNKEITQFHLGTNVKGIGDFDDVVLRYDVSNQSQSKIIFLQAKHKENINKDQLCYEKIFNESGDFSLYKYFESYLNIKEKFNKSDTKDNVFSGAFEHIDSYFVIFTSAAENFSRKKYLQSIDSLNNILLTKKTGSTFQLEHEDKDIDVLEEIIIKRRVKKLGEKLVEFIFENNNAYVNMMSDKLIKKYHVILALDVFELYKEDENQNYYNGKFRETFLNNNDDKLLLLLRETFYNEIVKDKIKLLEMSNNLSLESLIEIIGCKIMYDAEQKELISVNQNISTEPSKLKERIEITKSIIETAIKMAGKKKMESHRFKLDLLFGNLDLKIRKSKRIGHLVGKFIDIFTNPEITVDNIVKIDDHILNNTQKLNKGDIQVNGGIGGLIGNLLILDKGNDIKMTLKFNENPESLPKVAKELYTKLEKETLKQDKLINKNLQSYRFIIQVDDLPRLSLSGEMSDKYLVKEFLDKLFFYTNQAKEHEVEHILLQEISDYYHAPSSQSKSLFKLKNEAIFLKAHDMVQKWWKLVEEAPYLTKHCKFFCQAAAEFIDEPLLSILNYVSLNDIKKYEIEFDDKPIKKLKIDEFIKSDKQILCMHSESCRLSIMKLIQYFKDKDLNYLLINLNYILKIQCYDEVINEITNTKINVLIVEITDSYKDINTCSKKLFEDLKKTLNKNASVRLIIISENDNIHSEELNDFFTNVVEDKYNNFEDLDDLTQNKLLQEKVIFQGKAVTLGTIMDKNLKHISINELLRHVRENVQISRELPGLGEVKYYYVDQVFTRYLTLKERSLMNKIENDDLFLISGVEKHELSYLNNDKIADFEKVNCRDNTYLKKFFIANKKKSALEQFQMLTYNYPGRNIHWLDKNCFGLEWQKSYGNLSALHTMIDKGKDHRTYKPKAITDINDRIVILTAEPGMGKSTVLSYLADQLDSSIWTVRINLNDFTELLSRTNFENNMNEAINFILDVLDLKSSFEKEMLQYEITDRGNIILLIDGFDEICPIYEEKVLNLLRILKSTKVRKLWITTRMNMRNKLEDELGTLAYTLKPLTISYQIEFLEKFWTWKLDIKNIDKKLFSSIFEELLKNASLCINDNGQKFFSTVLHLQMLSETFENEFRFLYYNGKLEWVKLLKFTNLMLLYDDFVEKKFDLYSKENMRQDNTNAAVINKNIKLRKDFIQNHENAAIYTLFKDHEYFNSLFSKNELKKIIQFKREIHEGIENTGIIYNVINDKPNFIHRTFAEYFAANWLANNIDNNEVKKFLEENILKEEHCMLHEFLEHKLGGDLHVVVLNDGTRVEFSMREPNCILRQFKKNS